MYLGIRRRTRSAVGVACGRVGAAADGAVRGEPSGGGVRTVPTAPGSGCADRRAVAVPGGRAPTTSAPDGTVEPGGSGWAGRGGCGRHESGRPRGRPGSAGSAATDAAAAPEVAGRVAAGTPQMDGRTTAAPPGDPARRDRGRWVTGGGRVRGRGGAGRRTPLGPRAEGRGRWCGGRVRGRREGTRPHRGRVWRRPGGRRTGRARVDRVAMRPGREDGRTRGEAATCTERGQSVE